MTNKLFTAKSIIAGLLIAQVIATSHVYLSNWRLHHAIATFNAAGWFDVPTAPVTGGMVTGH